MVKRDAGGKKGKLLCCKHVFDQIKATYNLAEIQLKKHQNVQKTHFLQKVPGVNGLSCVIVGCIRTIPSNYQLLTKNGWKSVLLSNVNCANSNRLQLIPTENDHNLLFDFKLASFVLYVRLTILNKTTNLRRNLFLHP